VGSENICIRKGQPVIRRILLCLSLLSLFGGLAPAANAQADPATTAQSLAPYRVNPGDELQIFVWGDERLQRTVLVLPDGTFAFPLVGQIAAAGRLPSEIERLITAGLQPQYKGPVPQVTVSVSKATGYQFSVVGKVRSPGTFTPGRYVNALEALAMAGGPTEFAQTGSIRLVRKSGGQLVVVPVRLSDALKGDAGRLTTAEIPRIESGDTVVVP
jgi:polysaccharide export outer membrane protein